MYYGEDVVITPKGIRIQPKALNPIGIQNESVCWGIILPTSPDEPEKTPHFIISPFNPRNWLALFRLTIELKSDIGTIAKVTKLLDEKGFNILSTQCALSGYNHATWHIIGESLEQKEKVEKELDELIKNKFYKDLNAFDGGNDDFRIELTNDITLKMLEYSQSLEKLILEDNERLRKQNPQNSYLYENLHENDTLLYKEGKIKKNGFSNKSALGKFKSRLPETIHCRWLTQLVIYRIYSEAQDNGRVKKFENEEKFKRGNSSNKPIRFNYNSKNSILEPADDSHKEQYLETIKRCVSGNNNNREELPVRVIGTFNPQENYVRVVFPDKMKRDKQLSIQVGYEVNLTDGAERIKSLSRIITRNKERLRKTKDKASANRIENSIKEDTEELRKIEKSGLSSIGLLKSITEYLSESKLNIDYVSNSILRYSLSKEVGRISLIVTPESPVDDINKLTYKIEGKLKDIHKDRKIITFKTPIVKRLGAKRIFFSTKFEFLKNLKEDFREKLEELATKYGFELVTGDRQLTNDYSDDDGIQNVKHSVTERIKSCDAFLQLYPNLPDKKAEKDREWLIYELGVAMGKGLFTEICVGKTNQNKYPNKIIEGDAMHIFDSYKDTDKILEEIKSAILKLDDSCHNR